MKKNIIAISREFGSGGRTIGKLVAEKLGIEFYDKDIIKKVAEESGLTRKYVEHYGEFAPSSDSVCRNTERLRSSRHACKLFFTHRPSLITIAYVMVISIPY